MAHYQSESHLEPLQHHPSHDIPNAAYPDAPYQPGQGQAIDGGSSISFPVSHSAATSALSLTPSNAGHFRQDEPWLGLTQNAPPPPPVSTYPSEPPPPYNPNESSPSFGPAGAASRNTTSSSSLSDATPLQTMSQPPQPSFQRPYHHHDAPGVAPSHQQHYAAPRHGAPGVTHPYPQPYATPVSSPNLPFFGDHDKSNLALDMNRQRKRRLRICILIASVIVFFIAAILLGVGLGVIRVATDDDDKR